MEGTRKSFAALHLSVLLAGFTGLFGRLVTLHETGLVWYRMAFTSVILLILSHGLPRIPRRKVAELAGCGALLGLHWILFYGSIKASNVSIGVLCYALVGFFTAFFEPIIFHKRISWVEVLFSLITVSGLLCVFSFNPRYRFGIAIGVVSAAVAALYGTMNKKVSVGVGNRTVLLYEMAGGLIIVSALIPLYLRLFPAQGCVLAMHGMSNLLWLLGLSAFCTVGLYLLQIEALRGLSAFTVNLTYNLEPCYSIILAFLFFGEGREVNTSFYVGIALVLISVGLQTWRQRRQSVSK